MNPRSAEGPAGAATGLPAGGRPAEDVPAAGAPEPHTDAGPERGRGAVRRLPASRRAPRLRSGVAAFLVVAALIGVAASTLALWSRDLVVDSDAYVDVVAPVLEDPAARSSIADYVAARAVRAVDLQGRLETALPPAAAMVAPALTRALQQFLQDETERFLTTEVARRLWVGVNREVHRQFVAALKGESRSVTIGRNDVTLDLVPLVAVALQTLEREVPDLLGRDVTLPRIDPSTAPQDIRVKLQDALGRRLPDDLGVVTLVRGGQGHALKVALARLDDLVLLVVALTAGLVAAALLVSVRRRPTALWLGLGGLLVFAAARALETRLEEAMVQAVRTSSGAAVARSVLTAAVASLNGFFAWVAVAGAVVVVAALLAGKPAWTSALGRAVADVFGVASDLATPDTRAGRWIHRRLDLLRVGGVVAAVVALLFVAGSWPAIGAVAVALAIYELALAAYAAGSPQEPDAELSCEPATPGPRPVPAGTGDQDDLPPA